MKVLDLIAKARSIRRYDEAEKISMRQLELIAAAARIVPSTANMQRIRLMLINDERCEKIFNELSFARALKPAWNGPEEGERPVAYIVIMTDKEPDTNLAIDIGIAAEAMLLAATEAGLGGCMFRSFDSERLGAILDRAPYMPSLVMSIGKPNEVVILQDADDERLCGDLRYYRNEHGHHIVPKLSLKTLVLE